MIDFGKLGNNIGKTQVDPRDIFMALPSRDKQYEYPRDVQSEVWKQWFSIRNQKNNIIKMNTGSGKTVVGLIILKSCLNEGKGPAVYVVPDNYLVEQVFQEGERLGISVTKDEDDIDYKRKRAILVINIQKLINGRSVFGMRPSNNVPIGSVIIDDVHACLATIENQYTISIPDDSKLYDSLIEMFNSSLKAQSESKLSDILENKKIYENMLVPFWDWQNKSQEIYKLLSNNMEEDYIGFSFPLLRDSFELCNCMVSSRNIEISPKCIPIEKITSYIHAERKIFMSATLQDDSVFITALGLKSEDISTIISPERANDIGDRLILFPQVMNSKITDDEIKLKLKDLSEKHNVVIIVPSTYRQKYWSDVANLSLSATNINGGIDKLKNKHVGLVTLLNKYDGIDLPNDACRILVIDGLPKMRSEYDAYEQNANPHGKRLCSEQIQKIEQGMGRGVRSNTDYCVIILMGRGLADIIYSSDGLQFFSDATKEQFMLSERIWDQLKHPGEKPDINQIMELTQYSLFRNIDWITISKDTLAAISYSTEPHFDSMAIAARKAYEYAQSRRFEDAVDTLTIEKSKTSSSEMKGLIKQYIAEYTNFYNPEEAQEILLSASDDNKMLIKPIQGVRFTKILNKTGEQAQSFIEYVTKNNINPNNYILKINALLETLAFIPETANSFEAALKEISHLIGIYSNRPEKEAGRGPDNFWDLGNSKFLIIECKNGTTTETISKHDCNQLNGSIQWFESLYHDNSCIGYPLMIHNSNIFEYACSPNSDIRIMTPKFLDLFKHNVLKFSISVTQAEAYNNTVKIHELLEQFKLLGKDIFNIYSSTYKTKAK